MDFADDVAYSVYDLEDFFRAGKIPLDRIFASNSTPLDSKLSVEAVTFLEGTFARWDMLGIEERVEKGTFRSILKNWADLFPILQPYKDTPREQGTMTAMASTFVARYLSAIKMADPPLNDGPHVVIEKEKKDEIIVLKELTWHYVIANPDLATQQVGYKHVIEHLFKKFWDAAKEGNKSLFPPSSVESLAKASDDGKKIRVIIDLIASMTEPQALDMHQRFLGITPGSFFQSAF